MWVGREKLTRRTARSLFDRDPTWRVVVAVQRQKESEELISKSKIMRSGVDGTVGQLGVIGHLNHAWKRSTLSPFQSFLVHQLTGLAARRGTALCLIPDILQAPNESQKYRSQPARYF